MTDTSTATTTTAVDTEWSKYKSGTPTSLGGTLKEVLQLSSKGVVFLNQDDELEWEYDEATCGSGVNATAEATALIAQLGFAGLKRKKLRRAQLLIAAGLSCAFDENNPDCERHFVAAKQFVQTRQTERLQTAYLIAVLLAGALAVSAIAPVVFSATQEPVWREFAIGISLGAVGSVVSVSQRFRNIVIDRYGSLFFTAVAGTARVFFGALFGFTLVILQKSGIVLAGIEGNPYALAAAALVAGFSERVIPDLVGKVESTLSGDRQSAGS